MKVDTETVYRLVGGLASSKVLVVMLSSFLEPSEVESLSGKNPSTSASCSLFILCPQYCVISLESASFKNRGILSAHVRQEAF